MNKQKLFLIDSDALLRDSLREQFEISNEFVFEDVSNGEDGLVKARFLQPDLFLLGITITNKDCLQLGRQLRNYFPAVPIIVLITMDDHVDIFLQTELWFDGSFIKPFKFSILLDEMRTVLRKRKPGTAANHLIGPYLFIPERNLLIDREAGQKRVRLTDKESSILEYLLAAEDSHVSRRRLLDEVWGYEGTATTHTVETHIYRLRQKMERDPSNAKLLRTEPGGYRLTP